MSELQRVIDNAERLLPGVAAPEGEDDPRWQAIIDIGEHIATEPDEVWSFVAKWGTHDSLDLQAAIATCLLEHLLEHDFDRFLPKVSVAVGRDERFLRTFSQCWTPEGETRSQAFVRVVSVPEGDAPIKVREAWVGLALPIIGDSATKRRILGVASIPKSPLGRLLSWITRRGTLQRCFWVPAHSAAAVLSEARPEAADWWNSNLPHVVARGEWFGFDSRVCELVEDPADEAQTPSRSEGYCPKCGYDARGEFDSGCSECGWGREAQEP